MIENEHHYINYIFLICIFKTLFYYYQKLVKIDNIKYEHHKIACGEPPNFQGDERDIIFLSMVDSNENDYPLNMMSAEGDRKRRYNVAVSRAKNQVWLVHSLDVAKDLKEEDKIIFSIYEQEQFHERICGGVPE